MRMTRTMRRALRNYIIAVKIKLSIMGGLLITYFASPIEKVGDISLLIFFIMFYIWLYEIVRDS